MYPYSPESLGAGHLYPQPEDPCLTSKETNAGPGRIII